MVAHFQFECTKTLARDPTDPTRLAVPRDFGIFPRSLGQLIAASGVESFRLTLARGLWDPRWGEATLADGTSLSAPQGAELVAEFRGPVPEERVEQGWKTLTSRLAGLSCASLSFLAKPTTVARPQLGGVSAEPVAHAAGARSRASAGHTRYGSIGRETVCTENLTPWLKHLPCAGSAGLAARIRPLRVFGAQHHSLGLEVVSRDWGPGGERTNVTVKQSLMAVLDGMGEDGLVSLLDSGPTPVCSAMSDPTGSGGASGGSARWRLDFPRGVSPSSHPLPARWGLDREAFASLGHGSRASIRVEQAGKGSTLGLEAAAGTLLAGPGGEREDGHHGRVMPGAPVEITRYLLDHDGLRGRLVSRIVNRDPSHRAYRVLLYEAVPW